MSRVVYNGKRSGGPRSPGAGSEIFTPAHEENVRFIYEGERGGGRWVGGAKGSGRSGRAAAVAVAVAVPAAWQCVERDLRSQMGSERGLVEEYVEKMPNPSLKGASNRGTAPAVPARGCRTPGGDCAASAPKVSPVSLAAFKPVDLGDLKRRNTQDAKKS